jgi:hypothetical protein
MQILTYIHIVRSPINDVTLNFRHFYELLNINILTYTQFEKYSKILYLKIITIHRDYHIINICKKHLTLPNLLK